MVWTARPTDILQRRLRDRSNKRSEIVINEIFYDPYVKTDLTEFIELYNPGSAAVSLSGVTFSKGITYSFPAGATLAPGAYLVLTENTAQFAAKFGKTAFGQFEGNLSNEGEEIQIINAAGGVLDDVDYQLGFPWPTTGGSPGYSIELVNPDFDNNLRRKLAQRNDRDWDNDIDRKKQFLVLSQRHKRGFGRQTVVETHQLCSGFTWFMGTGTIGYDDNKAFSGSPELSDMKGGYTTVYLRKYFSVSDLSTIQTMILSAKYDDGFVCWINGNYVASSNSSTTSPGYNAKASTESRESSTYDTFSWPARRRTTWFRGRTRWR